MDTMVQNSVVHCPWSAVVSTMSAVDETISVSYGASSTIVENVAAVLGISHVNVVLSLL